MAEEAPFELSQRDPAEPADAPREPEEREREEGDGDDAQTVRRGDELPRAAAVREEAARRDAGASEAPLAIPPREQDRTLSSYRDGATEVAKERTAAMVAPAPVATSVESGGKQQEEGNAAPVLDSGTSSAQATGAPVQDRMTRENASAVETPSRSRRADNRKPWAQAYRRLVTSAAETQAARAGAGSAAGPREPEIAAAKLEARSGAGETARIAAFGNGQAGNPAEAALRELLASVNQNHREAMEYRSHQI